MSKKSSIATVAALAVAAGGGFAAYKYLNPGSSQPDSLATAIPANAYMAAYISNDPEAWGKLEKFGTPAAQKMIKEQLTKLQSDMLKESKMSYAQDVQPWLGNVMVAALPSVDPKSTEPEVVVAIGIKDKLKALAFNNKLKETSKEVTKETDYKGVKVTQTGKGSNESFSAILDDKVLVSTKRKAIEASIDTTQGQPSLAKQTGDDWFKSDTLGLKQPIAAFYIPDYGNLVRESLKSAQGAVPLDGYTLEQLKKVKSIGGGIAIDDGGIRMKMVAKTDGSVPQLPDNPGKSIERFPSKTIMLAGGSGLTQLWTEVTKVMDAQPTTKTSLAEMRKSFTDSTKLDLDRDVFSWMGGEYAIGMLPVTTGITAQAGVGGALTIDSTNKSVTDNTMSKLAEMAKANGIQVAQRQVGGKSFTDWQAPGGKGTFLTYGWLDNTMMMTLGDGLAEQLATPSGETLNRNPNFTASFNSIPQQKQSYFYLDMAQTAALINSKLMPMSGTTMPAEATAFIDSVRGIGMASATTDKTTTQFETLIALKKQGE
jgi:hypothetical protein